MKTWWGRICFCGFMVKPRSSVYISSKPCVQTWQCLSSVIHRHWCPVVFSICPQFLWCVYSLVLWLNFGFWVLCWFVAYTSWPVRASCTWPYSPSIVASKLWMLNFQTISVNWLEGFCRFTYPSCIFDKYSIYLWLELVNLWTESVLWHLFKFGPSYWLIKHFIYHRYKH